MLPNLIVIGGQKCGTTSLHYYLSRHPEIFMSRVKELNFFLANRNWSKGVGWYEAQFARAGAARIRGESSPFYTDHPFEPGVPARMHSVVPEARLIFLVRDPLERLMSHYIHWVALRREDRPLAGALTDFTDNSYLTRGLYARQLAQYRPHYPLERIRVVASEDLRDRRRDTLREIFHWLGVDDTFDSPQFEQLRFRAGDQLRKNRLGLWLTPVMQRLAASERLPAGLRWRLKALPYFPFSRPVARPTLDAGLRRELIEFFRDDVAQLRALTGQAFADWCV